MYKVLPPLIDGRVVEAAVVAGVVGIATEIRILKCSNKVRKSKIMKGKKNEQKQLKLY